MSDSEFVCLKNNTSTLLPNNGIDFIVQISNSLKNRIAIMVYFLLYDLSCKSSNKENTVVASHEQIAIRLNISVRSSARAIRFLRLKGYIDAYQLKNTGKKYQPNTIKIKYPEHLLCPMSEHNESQGNNCQFK